MAFVFSSLLTSGRMSAFGSSIFDSCFLATGLFSASFLPLE